MATYGTGTYGAGTYADMGEAIVINPENIVATAADIQRTQVFAFDTPIGTRLVVSLDSKIQTRAADWKVGP